MVVADGAQADVEIRLISEKPTILFGPLRAEWQIQIHERSLVVFWNAIQDEDRTVVLEHTLERRRTKQPIHGLQIRLVTADGATGVLWIGPKKGAEALRSLKGVVAADLAFVFRC